MRYIRYGFLIALGVILISVSLANRQMVTLSLMPDALADLIGTNTGISLPLFVVIVLGVVAGLVIGFVWEWLREHKHRREVGDKARQVRRLEREVSRLKQEKHEGKDEVLAILDETG